MIRPDQIPDEVVEAAARADYEAWRDWNNVRGDTLDWEHIEPDAQEDHRAGVRVSIAAAINAWPGASQEGDVYPGNVVQRWLELPLPQKEPSE